LVFAGVPIRRVVGEEALGVFVADVEFGPLEVARVGVEVGGGVVVEGFGVDVEGGCFGLAPCAALTVWLDASWAFVLAMAGQA
jgi:hypothetical protein